MHTRHWTPTGVVGVLLLTLTCSLPAHAAPTWRPSTDVSPLAGFVTWADLAVGDDGTSTAVWGRTVPSAHDVVEVSTRLPGDTWSTPVPLSDPDVGANAPDVVAGPGGTATAVWQTVTDEGDSFLQTSTRAADGTWSAAEDLVGPTDFSPNPQVAVDSAGTVTVLWAERSATKLVVRASSRPRGGGWTAPVDVSDPEADSVAPQVAVDSAGTVTVL